MPPPEKRPNGVPKPAEKKTAAEDDDDDEDEEVAMAEEELIPTEEEDNDDAIDDDVVSVAEEEPIAKGSAGGQRDRRTRKASWPTENSTPIIWVLSRLLPLLRRRRRGRPAKEKQPQPQPQPVHRPVTPEYTPPAETTNRDRAASHAARIAAREAMLAKEQEALENGSGRRRSVDASASGRRCFGIGRCG